MRYFPKEKTPIKVNINEGIASSFVRQPSLVDEYYFEKTVSSVDGEEVVGIHNPLYMLFNQQRLDRLGPEAVRQWIDSLNQAQHSALNDLRSKCSDDDLLCMVRSRHIQHPAELERYISDLDARADKFNSEIAKIRAQMEFDAQQQVQTNSQSSNTE